MAASTSAKFIDKKTNYLFLSLQCGDLPFSKTEYVSAWLFREFFAILWFAKALLDPQIKWRTGTYRLKWGGQALQIESPPPATGDLKTKL